MIISQNSAETSRHYCMCRLSSILCSSFKWLIVVEHLTSLQKLLGSEPSDFIFLAIVCRLLTLGWHEIWWIRTTICHTEDRSQSNGPHLRYEETIQVYVACSSLLYCACRHCISRSTPLPVMCGAMELWCMRYGACHWPAELVWGGHECPPTSYGTGSFPGGPIGKNLYPELQGTYMHN